MTAGSEILHPVPARPYCSARQIACWPGAKHASVHRISTSPPILRFAKRCGFAPGRKEKGLHLPADFHRPKAHGRPACDELYALWTA